MALPLFGKSIAASTGLVTVEREHQACHEGKAFALRLANAALANNGILQVHLRIPSDVQMHLKEMEYWCEGKAALLLKVGGTFATESGAADIQPFNHLSSAKASKITGFTTFTPGGSPVTLISYTDGGGTNPANRVPASTGSKWEHIFSGQDILVSIQNVSGSASVVWLALKWYEV